MRKLTCFINLFALSGLVLGSMESEMLINIFGNVGKNIAVLFALPLLMLIKNSYNDIRGVIFGLLFGLSVLSYFVLTVVFVK